MQSILHTYKMQVQVQEGDSKILSIFCYTFALFFKHIFVSLVTLTCVLEPKQISIELKKIFYIAHK